MDLETLEKRILNHKKTDVDLIGLEKRLETDPGIQLPEPSGMMSARSYRTKIGLSVIDKLRKRIRELLALYSEAIDKYFQPTRQNSIYCNDNQYLEKEYQ